MSTADKVAGSDLLSALYTSYERGLNVRVSGGVLTARERNAKLSKARNNMVAIMNEINNINI